MDLTDLLAGEAGEIIDEAARSLERSKLKHYQAVGATVSRKRLEELFSLVVRCLGERDLVPMVDYSTAVARERFADGFDIHEVQTAFNVLEEAIWRRVVAGVPPEQLAESIGLVATVLGAGKDALARTYVSLAAHQHVPSLDLSALFEGTV